jgi:LAS superfamily LD-carboxypeptidase LdcB
VSYEEKRVTTKVFGTLPSDSPLLVSIPTALGHAPQRLHKLAARGLQSMAEAAAADLGIVLLAASGWRLHRWRSWPEYVNFVTSKYGSLAEGRKFLAFNSPHETGLALDFGCGGIEPDRATLAKQRATPLWKWLHDNAWRFGWTPYLQESWHWEYWIDLASYQAGELVPTASNDLELVTTCSDPNDVCVEVPLDKI